MEPLAVQLLVLNQGACGANCSMRLSGVHPAPFRRSGVYAHAADPTNFVVNSSDRDPSHCKVLQFGYKVIAATLQ